MQAETQQLLTVEREGSAAIVTMVNESKRNALSLSMMCELQSAFEVCGHDRSIRAIVLRARARRSVRDTTFANCAVAMKPLTKKSSTSASTSWRRSRSTPQPVIAEVDAMATAAGAQLVAACDLAVASTRARFATPGVRIGLFCSTPMVALSRGDRAQARARDAAYRRSDRRADGARLGTVNRVVAPGDLRETTLALAAKIAEASAGCRGAGEGRPFTPDCALDQRRHTITRRT